MSKKEPEGSAMEPSQLTETERESFDRAMATIDGMSDEDRRALLARSVAAAIRYAGKREDETLIQAGATLLRTIRVYANPEYVRAMARRAPTFDGRAVPDNCP